MGALNARLRRALLLACACVGLCTSLAAAAEPALMADFDGDGQRDRVTLDSREPSIVRVWLSTTGTTAVIRSRAPLLRLVAIDLDGDHRQELIARDTAANLQVWTSRRAKFRSYRPHRITPGTVARPTHRAWDDGPTNEPSALSGTTASMTALVLSPEARAPAVVGTNSFCPVTHHSRSALPFAPLAPRPPPLAL